MPQKHVVKPYSANSYYHLYNRLVPELGMALDDASKAFMIKLFNRHLSPDIQRDMYGNPFKNLSEKVDLLAFCVMDNHLHLLVYQHEPRAIEELMRSISTSYSVFLNKHYNRSGSIFETVFKGKLIVDESHLMHISRYIHRNPGRFYKDYEYSSYLMYDGRYDVPEWLNADTVLEMFDGRRQYLDFCAEDYAEGSTLG